MRKKNKTRIFDREFIKQQVSKSTCTLPKSCKSSFSSYVPQHHSHLLSFSNSVAIWFYRSHDKWTFSNRLEALTILKNNSTPVTPTLSLLRWKTISREFHAQIIHARKSQSLHKYKKLSNFHWKKITKAFEFECVRWEGGEESKRGARITEVQRSLIGWKGEKNIHYYYCYHHQPQEGSP